MRETGKNFAYDRLPHLTGHPVELHGAGQEWFRVRAGPLLGALFINEKRNEHDTRDCGRKQAQAPFGRKVLQRRNPSSPRSAW
jgi:hypothetical protein